MRNKMLLGAVSTIVLGIAGTSFAQDNSQGLYVSVGLGAGKLQSVDYTDTAFINHTNNFVNTYENGTAGYLAVGYDFGNSYRAELDLSTANGEGDQVGKLNPALNGSATASDVSLMVNLIKDFNISDTVDFYLGGGVGVGEFRHRSSLVETFNNADVIHTVDSSNNSVAYQAMLGTVINLVNNVDLDVSYRLRGAAGGVEVDYPSNNQGVDHVTHNALVGLKLNFAKQETPKEEPVQYKTCWDGSYIPVTQSCPVEDEVLPEARQITVYFDFDSYELSNSGLRLIEEAVASKGSYDIGKVMVEGNTDRSGSNAYNKKLSEKRAVTVRNALVSLGVDPEMIMTRAYGENNLAKDTDDGVKEPLNRRADVTIKFE